MKLRLIAASFLIAVSAYGQGSQTPLYNAVLQSDLDAAGFKILSSNMADYAGTNITWNVATGKFDATGGGGSGTVTSITADYPLIMTPDPTTTTGAVSLDFMTNLNWDTAYADRLKWNGGATGLTAATGRTSLGLVIGTDVEAWLGNPSVNGYVLSSTTGGVRSWIAPATGGGGAPTTVDYLVGTADATLSSEIVVGTSPGGELGGTWASPTIDDSISVTSWTLVTPTIAAISNLTGNGFVKTSGGVGTLSVDTATYQASDADLTTWAGVTPTSGIQTWLATPSSANLRGALTDENGTGVALFSGAVAPVFSGAVQFWNGSTSAGTIRILEDSDDGTNYAQFTVPPLAANTLYTLPPDDGNSGDFLRSDGAGILTWVAPAGGGNVSNSGTPTVDQLGIWVTATTIKGLTTLPATNFPALTGDVTTTAGALGTTIGANKVTLAMMATMATDSILGRATASTGNVEVLAALPWADTGDVTRAADGKVTVLAAGNAGNLNSGTLLAARMPAYTGDVTSSVGTTANTLVNIPATTTIGGAAGTRGDVLYYGASGWAKLGVGTNGNQLTTHAAGADPTWDAPGTGGGGAVSDGAFPTGWDTDTTNAPSRNAVYDYLHLSDTDDDGKVNVLDQVAGITNTDASGVVQTPITNNSTNWNTAFTQTREWDTSLGIDGTGTAAQGRTALGATTVGSNIFTLTNPSAISYPRIDATNVVTAASAATIKTDLSLSNVTNDAQIKASDFPASSVDGEVSLFSGTSGKAQKRATGSGIAKHTAGVLSLITAPTGALVGDTDTQTLTNKRISPRVVTSATGNTTPTPNGDTTDLYIATAMTVNMVFGAPTGTPTDGQKLIIRIKDSGSVRTIGWNAVYRAIGVTLPTTTVASKTIYVGAIWNAADSDWDVIAVASEV